MMLSVIIPVYNSEKIINNLVKDISEQIKKINKIKNFEIILVNDSSDDKSWNEITNICKMYNFVVGINLTKNSGQHNAVMAGLKLCKGDFIITMDDDYQHSPNYISSLLDEIDKGYDVCYTNYVNKKYGILKKFFSFMNHKILNILLKKPKHIYLSSYKCFSKKIAMELIKYDGPFVYIDGLILNITNKLGIIDIEHSEREHGKSNYSYKKLISLWLKVVTNFSVVPLRLVTIFGFLMTLVSIVLIITIIFIKLSNPEIPAGWPSLAILVIFFAGIQLIALGIIGEYIGKSYLNLNKKPQYTVRETINYKKNE